MTCASLGNLVEQGIAVLTNLSDVCRSPLVEDFGFTSEYVINNVSGFKIGN